MISVLTEIPAGSIQHSKFRNVVIFDNTNLTYISPDFYNVTASVTHSLQINANRIRNGSKPFSRLSVLQELAIWDNALGSNSSATDAFEGVSRFTKFDISLNYELIYLNETVFKSVLDNASSARSFFITGIPMKCDQRIYILLLCWICANEATYKNQIYGYLCDVDEFTLIWDYCAARNKKKQVHYLVSAANVGCD